MTADERLQNRAAKNESTTDLESSDTGQKRNERAGKKNCHCYHPVEIKDLIEMAILICKSVI